MAGPGLTGMVFSAHAMPLLLFKPWPVGQDPREDWVRSARQAGFDGLQGPPPTAPEQRLLLHEQLQEADLAFISNLATASDPTVSPNQHLLDLRTAIECSLDLSPLLINACTGSDAWPLPLQIDFFEKILALESEYGIEIAVETSRGRPFFHPWITREIVHQLPELKLACNFAQWCCTTGRLVMEDDPRLLRDLARHGRHLHATVGFQDGPQVPDPRVPARADPLEKHLRWWETVWTAQSHRGLETITMQPGFQADNRFPQIDADEVNRWMARLLRARFAAWEQNIPAR